MEDIYEQVAQVVKEQLLKDKDTEVDEDGVITGLVLNKGE